MQKFSSKLLPIIVLVYLISINQIDCSCRSNRGPPKCGPAHRAAPRRPAPNRCHKNYQNQTTIDTTFMYDSGTVKVGDHLQCKLVNVTLVKNRSNCNTHVYIQRYSNVYLHVSNNSKCISFQARNEQDLKIFLSNTQSQSGSKIQINLDNLGQSFIFYNGRIMELVSTPSDILNDQELKPFWIRYDNNFLEVGYGNSSTPFLSHQFTSDDGFPSTINSVGISSLMGSIEWITDAEPVCGTKNSTPTPTQTQHQVKTVCKVKPSKGK